MKAGSNRSPTTRDGTSRHLPGSAVPLNSGFPAVVRDGELAAEVLDVITETELEEFLGGLLAEAAQNSGHRLPAGTSRALAEVL